MAINYQPDPRIKQLEELAPIRERELLKLQTHRKVRVDERTVKLVKQEEETCEASVL